MRRGRKRHREVVGPKSPEFGLSVFLSLDSLQSFVELTRQPVKKNRPELPGRQGGCGSVLRAGGRAESKGLRWYVLFTTERVGIYCKIPAGFSSATEFFWNLSVIGDLWNGDGARLSDELDPCGG